MKQIGQKNLFISYLGLFTSVGTLLCCALPSLFVALGMGAVVAGVVGSIPQLVLLSEYKVVVFSVSGVLILLSAWSLYLQRNAPCPIDPSEARACTVARKWSLRSVCVAIFFWLCGFFAAFVLPLIVA